MTDRGAVADALEEIGLLLELRGENPFKTRAYANAARVVRALDRDLDALIRDGELRGVKGIGAAIAEAITTFAATGRLPFLEQLRAETPPGLLEWLRIPGLGPKKARVLSLRLGIATLDELERACREGRVRSIEGFGETSERKIAAGIEQLRSRSGRFLQPVVRAAAERLLAAVGSVPGVLRAEVAGSLRRRTETSKDVDLVVAATSAAEVMDAFVGAPGVVEVTGRGPTKCSVRLAEGPAADLRVVSPEAFPFALAYFTGSKAHNVALRSRAQRLGLRLNEYALVRETGGEPVPCEDEAAIYGALGLDPIPPELREDGGEIEAAAERRLPRLLEEGDLRGILHCHSTWSDGTSTIREMADAARAMGMTYLGLCDHSRTAAYAGGLSIDRLREQRREIDALNESYGGTFRVLQGIESDILADGSLDYPDEVLAELDLVVGSVHSRFGLSAEEQTARLVKAIDHPYLDIVGHVTGRLLLSREGYALDLPRVLEAAAARGVAVEINSHPERLDLDPSGVRYGLARGMKTSIDPDAHSTDGLRDVRYGVGIARKGWATADDVLNAWPLDRLLDHLAARRRRAGATGGPRARS